jgi:hypothetical protein
VAERTGKIRIFTDFQQSYVAVNTIQARAVKDGPAVIPAVNYLWWHTALGLSVFTTYHITSIEAKAFTVCPAAGDVMTVTFEALTTGVIGDSRATVATTKAFRVENNRIVRSKYLEVGFVGEKWFGLCEELESGKCKDFQILLLHN